LRYACSDGRSNNVDYVGHARASGLRRDGQHRYSAGGKRETEYGEQEKLFHGESSSAKINNFGRLGKALYYSAAVAVATRCGCLRRDSQHCPGAKGEGNRQCGQNDCAFHD
jgi:hypothetical protein